VTGPGDLLDVAVVGGGPAGAATCLRLATSGLRVGLFERSHFQAPRVGEVLAPPVSDLLRRLGVGEDFERAGFLRSHGVSSVWGSDRVAFRDFVFGSHGWGWHVERRALDALLCTAASAGSTDVHLGAVVRSCRHDPGLGWCLTVAQAGQIRTYRARFLVVATGRAGLRGTFLDRTRLRDDRLVGLVRYFDATGSAMPHTRACIQAVRDGWWYAARLPDDVLVAAYLTDADLLPRPGPRTEAMWSSLVESAPLIRSLLHDQAPRSSPRLVAAGSWRRVQVAGNHCVAVGDAAMAFDPLSGQGVYRALESGMRAADAIGRTVEGNQRALSDYAAWVQATYEAYRRERRWTYRLEHRWPSSTFWARRHGTLPPRPGRRCLSDGLATDRFQGLFWPLARPQSA
jgi:flavin-dependent dehydrogenase